jgi:hypothetical protein
MGYGPSLFDARKPGVPPSERENEIMRMLQSILFATDLLRALLTRLSLTPLWIGLSTTASDSSSRATPCESSPLSHREGIRRFAPAVLINLI